MIGVLVRLQALTIRGRVVRSLRLLRQPKYLVGSIVGALWMFTWVGRGILRATMYAPKTGFDGVPADLLPTLQLAVALAVTLGIILPWLWPWGRLGLRFREAELTLLLQAPLTRRLVIGYGLLKAGLGTLFSAAFLTWVLGQRFGGRLALFAGILPLFAFWSLNGKWRAMFLLEQREHPRAGTRRAIVTAICGGYVVILALIVMRFAPQIRVGDTFNPPPPLLMALLLPGRALTAPIFAQGTGRALLAALPVMLLAVVQLELVLRSRAPFEESSLEWAREHEARHTGGRRQARAPRGQSRRWQVFELGSNGPVELAVLWKNLMRVSRLPLSRAFVAALLFLAVVVVMAWVMPVYPAIYGAIAATGLIAAAMAPLFAGMSWNNDLRTELMHLELVRTWPVAPVRFVLAEVASPALLSTLVGLFGLGLALAGYLGERISAGRGVSLKFLPAGGNTLGVSVTTFVFLLLVSYVPLLAAASFATSAVHNLATLFVPAWMVQTADTQRGIAALGRNMIVGLAMFFGFAVVLLPSAALVGLALLVQHYAGIPWSAWAFPLWGILAAAPLFALGAMLVLLGGKLWSRLDPSAELLEIGR